MDGREALGPALVGERRAGDAGLVELHLFLRPLDSKASPSEIEGSWERALGTLRQVEQGYVWNGGVALGRRRAWVLVGKGHWTATVRYGDNVEDEWFAVHCIWKLTSTNPEFVGAVRDLDDGEFLLVEAADKLPDWLASEDDGAGRVFIYRGSLRIVPPPEELLKIGPIVGPAAGNIIGNNKLTDDAIRLVVDPALGHVATKPPPLIESVIKTRLSVFEKENAAQRNVRVSCLVPPLVAVMLQGPFASESLAQAVTKFSGRDAVEMRRAEKLDFLAKQGQDPKIDFVRISITISRFMLSRLLSSQFSPPKRLGPWGNDKDVSYSQRSVGDRLTIGLEIALIAASKSTTPVDLERGDIMGWTEFLEQHEEAIEKGDPPTRESTLYSKFAALHPDRENLDLCLILGFYDRKVLESPDLQSSPEESEVDNEGIISAAEELSHLSGDQFDGNPIRSRFPDIDQGTTAFQSLLNKSSTVDGVEIDENVTGVEFDAESFRRITLEAIGEIQNDDTSDATSDDTDLAQDLEELKISMASLMGGVMNQMDEELASKGISLANSVAPKITEHGISAVEQTGPVSLATDELDIDMNMVENLLSSIDAQETEPGPASNLIGTLIPQRHKP